jgi:carboxylesterase
MVGGRVLDGERKSTSPFFMEGHGANKRICLLMIHGFTGHPGDFRGMAAYLNDAGYTVQAIRLPGHGTTPEEMRRTRWEDWWRHTLVSYDLLQGLDPSRIIVPIGFSMGGLLAMRLSLARPVAGVVTLAAPVMLRDRRIRYAGIVRFVKRYIHKQPVISEYLLQERGAYVRTPLDCVHSLYKQIRLMRRLIPLVHAPIFIGQGLADGTVDPASADYLYRTVASRQKTLRCYPETSHAIMADVTRMELFRDVERFVAGLRRPFGAGMAEVRMADEVAESEVRTADGVSVTEVPIPDDVAETEAWIADGVSVTEAWTSGDAAETEALTSDDVAETEAWIADGVSVTEAWIADNATETEAWIADDVADTDRAGSETWGYAREWNDGYDDERYGGLSVQVESQDGNG